MQITAKKVKDNIKSLLAKANAATGKEHKSLSEAFEDLNLGYGVDQTEVFDGNIELEGEFEPGEPKITDYYEEGYAEGYSKGLEAGGGDGGFEAGKAEVYAQIEPINEQLENTLNGTDTGGKSYYDEFWDNYLPTETLNAAEYRFAGNGWNDKTFVPKRNIVLVGNAQYLFATSLIENIEKSLQDNGVILDTSRAKRLDHAFFYASCLVIPEISAISLGTVALTRTFGYARKLHTIRKIVVNENVPFDRTFESCDALENIIIEGVIGQNGFNVQWSTKLSKDSIISIINALSTTASGKSVTLSKVAVESAFGSTVSEEWISLITARSNWTINLVQGGLKNDRN